MPKSVNVKKSAAAQAQSIRAIQKAIKNGEPAAWMSVQKALGNGYFLLRNSEGREIRGTPRGLFTCGNMRISVGQIVVVEGNPKIGVEIVGAIQQRREAEQYVRKGQMPREVLASAIGVGAEETEEEDDFFESAADADEPEVTGGLKEQRAAAETRSAISSRVALLLANDDIDIDKI
jgi:hypothetical protein